MSKNDKLADALREIQVVAVDADLRATTHRTALETIARKAREALVVHATPLADPPAQGEWVVRLIRDLSDALDECDKITPLCDCRDNDGDPYPSQWLADVRAKAAGYLAQCASPQPAPAPVQVDEDCGCYTETTWAGGFEAIEQVQCAKHAQPPAPGERGAQTADDCWRYSPSVPLNPTQNALSILYDLGHDEGRYPEDHHAGKWAQVEAAYAAIAALQQRVPDAVDLAQFRPAVRVWKQDCAAWGDDEGEAMADRLLALIDQQQEGRK